MRSTHHPTPWLPLLIAFLGLAWCGYIAFPTANPAPCATSGCALFRDVRVAGLSLWWVGGAYFFILCVLCLRGHLHLARMLAGLALLADAALLLIMFFTAPCLDCLVVALFLALSYYFLRNTSEGWFSTSRPAPSILLPVWFGLFLGNAVLAANEQFPLHAISRPPTEDVRLFFSPSCPACRKALVSLGEGAVLLPVMESEEDFASILRFAALLERKTPVAEALERSLDGSEALPDVSLLARWSLRLGLMRNKAALFKQGFRALPLIQINGMPGGPQEPEHVEEDDPALEEPAPRPREEVRGPLDGHNGRQSDLPDFLENMDNISQCGGDNREPCE